MTDKTSEWRRTGNTTREAFRVAVARSWTAEPSPMRAEADAVYEAVAPFGLTRLAAAMAWHETRNGSWNCATAPAGQPCIPLANRNAWAMKAADGGWMSLGSYARAAEVWADRLLETAGPYARTRTIDELIRVYHPVGPDGNTEEGTARYVETVCREIDALPLVAEGGTGMAFGNVPQPKWTERLIPDRNNSAWNNLGQRTVRGVVYHRMLGTLWGTDGWFRGGGGGSALTDFGIDHRTAETLRWNPHDGTAAAGVSPNRAPWASGPWESPPGDGVAFVSRYGINAINRDLVSIEISGNYGDALSDAATEQLALLTAWLADRAGVAWDTYPVNASTGMTFVFWHNEFTAQKPCPGDVVMAATPAVIDRTKAILRQYQAGAEPAPVPPPAVTWPGKPAWLPDAMVTELFPEADPDPVKGKRTQGWLAYCRDTGRAPRRVKFHFVGTPGELIEFSDGMLLDRSGKALG